VLAKGCNNGGSDAALFARTPLASTELARMSSTALSSPRMSLFSAHVMSRDEWSKKRGASELTNIITCMDMEPMGTM